MKKIAIDMLPFTNKIKGAGFYIKRLIFFLQKLDRENEYYLYFGNCDNPGKLFEINAPNFKIIQFKNLKSRYTRVFFEQFIFPFKINKLKPDFLFCPSVAVPVFSFSGAKIITTIHDLIPIIFKAKYPFIQRNYINTISYLSAVKADIILTVSENSKKDIIKIFKIKESKIQVLYNFLPPNIPMPLNLKREDYFITVSTIVPRKNLEMLFKAFSLFYESHRNYKLYVIGGKGSNYDSIFDLVKNLRMEERIVFLGYVKDDDLYKYYQKAKALVYISPYEGFGIPPLEAMHFNCPVVVSDTSSLPEVVGRAGLLVDPYNLDSVVEGMNKIIDINLLSEKYKYFSDQINKFNGETETMKLLDIFKQVNDKID